MDSLFGKPVIGDHTFNNIILQEKMTLSQLEYRFSYSIIFRNKPIYNFFKENKLIIVGGSILSLLNKTTVNDYDIYLKSNITIEELKDIIKNFNEINSIKIRFLYESQNSICYKLGSDILQFIKLPHLMNKNCYQIFDNIDFSICMCAYDFEEERFIFHKSFIESYRSNSITFNIKTPYPISSLLRTKKYEKKGYIFNTKELLKICFTINRLNIKTYEDVINHLVGVSTSYYQDFLEYISSDYYKDMEFDCEQFFDLFYEFEKSKEVLQKLSNDINIAKAGYI